MNRSTLLKMLVACLAIAAGAMAQTTTASAPANDQLDFGSDGLSVPPAVIVNVHTPRTAQLLGEAYRRREPLVWKRVQYVAEMGDIALSAAAPYLSDAMKDPAPQVRAEAARSAASIAQPALLDEVERLLGDGDENVRREAVLAAATLAKMQGKTTSAIERGLADPQPQVIAAALQAAWTPQHAAAVAQKLAALSPPLQTEAAASLARLKATEHAAVLLPLLGGDVAQRAAAVRALGELANPAFADAAIKLLSDPHPTVRRQAVTAMGKVAEARSREAHAIQMLSDPDPTVRQAAAAVLTPMPSTTALSALAAQLNEPYAPLHEALRQSFIHPADAATRQAIIDFAAKLLINANPRRREDASLILGRLRSDAAADVHVALLQWDSHDPAKSDWALIAQAAESLGLIGEQRAPEPLMALVKPAPQAAAALQRPQRDDMIAAMSNAMLSAARLNHRAALAEAVRILQLDPGVCPGKLRAAAAFAVGVLSDPAKPPGVNLMGIYESLYEDRPVKFEALKALGNLRVTSAAPRLKEIAETEPLPELRWIAYWSYQRCANAQMAYTPPTEPRNPPVSITDLPR